MGETSKEVRRVPPYVAGAIAAAGYSSGGVLLGGGAHLVGFASWWVLTWAVLGCLLGYRCSRSVLRRLYSPRVPSGSP